MQDVILEHNAYETVENHDITELLYVDKSFDFAKDVPFYHEVWMLDFKYKPIRMIWADIPGPDARMQRKQIWYIVYQVTNLGKAFRTVEVPDDKLYQLYKLVEVDKPVRFAPVFTLEVHDTLRKEVEGFGQGHDRAVYSDRASARESVPVEDKNSRVPHVRAEWPVEGDCRRRDGLGRRHLAGRRPEQRLVFRLCRGPDERL